MRVHTNEYLVPAGQIARVWIWVQYRLPSGNSIKPIYPNIQMGYIENDQVTGLYPDINIHNFIFCE